MVVVISSFDAVVRACCWCRACVASPPWLALVYGVLSKCLCFAILLSSGSGDGVFVDFCDFMLVFVPSISFLFLPLDCCPIIFALVGVGDFGRSICIEADTGSMRLGVVYTIISVLVIY